MPLTRDVPLVSAGEVEALTHEEGLDNLNGGSATIDNSCVAATNEIIRKLKFQDIPPEEVSNTTDLKDAACYLAAAFALGSLPDDESKARADRYEKKGLQALAEFKFESIYGGKAGNRSSRGLPRSIHRDSVPVFNRPTDTRNPGDRPPHAGYLHK